MKWNYIFLVALVLSFCLNVYLFFKEPLVKETKVEVVKHDTIVKFQLKTDTIHFYKIKYKNKIYYDTVHIDNLVYIRDTAVVHRDSTENYTIDISAVKLDWYKLDIHARDTITMTQTVTNTVYKPKKSMKPQIGLYGGVGYDFNKQSFGPEVGVGLVVPLTKW